MILTGVIVFLCAFMFAPYYAFAQQEKPKPENTPKSGGFKNFAKLTEEQQQKLKEIHQLYSNTLEDIRLGSMKRKLELAEEMKKDDPDRKKIDEILNSINQLELKKQKTIMDEFFAIRGVLSADQRKFFTRKFIRQMTGGMKGQQ